MTEKEIENQILSIYPQHLYNLSELIETCLVKVTHIDETKKEWLENKDARRAVYGKYVSNLNATRIALYQANFFISNKEWTSIYNSEFKIKGDIDSYAYIKATDIFYRFGFYMSFVSGFEASIKMIINHLAEKGIPCERNYKGFITNTLGLKNVEPLLDIIKFIRNTIHNNGLHIPDNSLDDNRDIPYKELLVILRKNKQISVNGGSFIWNH